jgi:hypothetical protein
VNHETIHRPAGTRSLLRVRKILEIKKGQSHEKLVIHETIHRPSARELILAPYFGSVTYYIPEKGQSRQKLMNQETNPIQFGPRLVQYL